MEPKLGILFRDEFFGASYKLCGQSKNEGFDCFSFIYCFYKRCGIDMPDGIDGINATDYKDLWENNEITIQNAMWNYIDTFTDSIPMSKMKFGDIVIIRIENKYLYPSIYVGNGKIALSELDKGVTVCSLDMFELVDVRRRENSG